MSKGALLIRTIEVMRSQPGITVYELAGTLGRSERTLYRWLAELQADLQTPIHCDRGRYFLLGGAAKSGLDLDPTEILALKLSLKSSPFAADSPVGGYAASAWRKVRAAAAGGDLEATCRLAEGHSVHIAVPESDVAPALVETLERAVREHSRLRAAYRSQKSGRVKDYTIDPYALAFRRHSWYLVGYSAEHKKVVQFRLGRFVRASDTGVRFDPPADFSADRYFELSWEAWGGGEPALVRVRFSAEVAQMIAETKRHPTQKVRTQPDGSAIFEATVSGLEEIGIWIMGYGRHAEVLEPESLRDRLLDHARAMVDLYARPRKKDEALVGKLI